MRNCNLQRSFRCGYCAMTTRFLFVLYQSDLGRLNSSSGIDLPCQLRCDIVVVRRLPTLLNRMKTVKICVMNSKITAVFHGFTDWILRHEFQDHGSVSWFYRLNFASWFSLLSQTQDRLNSPVGHKYSNAFGALTYSFTEMKVLHWTIWIMPPTPRGNWPPSTPGQLTSMSMR